MSSYYLYVSSKHKQVLSSNLMKLLIDPCTQSFMCIAFTCEVSYTVMVNYSQFFPFELSSPCFGSFFTSKSTTMIKEDVEQSCLPL